MSPRDIHGEASSARTKVTALLASAADLDVIAAFRSSAAGIILEELLEHQVSTWERGGCWGAFNDDTKREQGRALRSRELLEYFKGAEEEAKRQRAEAMRLTTLLETAADQGRISRV